MSELSKKMAEAAALPRKVAIYAHLTSQDTFALHEVSYNQFDEHWQRLPAGQELEEQISGWVRISEIHTISCVPIEEDVVTQNAVASLDAQSRSLITEMNEQLAVIANRKAQLLALTYTPTPEPLECVSEAEHERRAQPEYDPVSEAEEVVETEDAPRALRDPDDDIPF